MSDCVSKAEDSLCDDLNGKEIQKKGIYGASLVVQCLRICLRIQGSWVHPLLWEDPTRLGTTRPVGQTTEPSSCKC